MRFYYPLSENAMRPEMMFKKLGGTVKRSLAVRDGVKPSNFTPKLTLERGTRSRRDFGSSVSGRHTALPQ